MKPSAKKTIIICLTVIIMTELFKRIPLLAQIYSQYIYPTVSRILHFISSLLPFSLYDIFIPAAIIFLMYIITGIFRKQKRAQSAILLLVSITALYCGFYFSWGINYFAPGFMQRNNFETAEFDSTAFSSFLEDYTKNLNYAWFEAKQSEDTMSLKQTRGINLKSVAQKLDRGYKLLNENYQMPLSSSSLRVKSMTYSSIYAKMGIKGYYGPYFAECHISRLLLPHQTAFTYAHESAHLMGITSEAEANLCAYIITTYSDDALTRFSGYYSLLPYVMINARQNLNEEDMLMLLSRISPEIKSIYNNTYDRWSELYSQSLGNIQDWFYQLYLKGNNIPDGTKNYSGVIALIMSIKSNQQQTK